MTKKLKGYGTFDVVLIVILVIVSFACVYPFWYVFANSFASYNVASRGAVAWWPSELSLDGYHAVFENKYLVSGFTVTVLRTIVATSAHVLFTSFVSYAMSRPNLIGKKIYMKIAMITMFFNGGLVSTYMVVANFLHLKNNFLALVLPVAVGLLPLFLLRWRMNLLTVGEEEAQSMGVRTGVLRLVVILCATLLTTASVAVSGMIGWVGLVIPHFCRMLFGYDYRRLIPAAALFGAAFLLAVDDIARLVTTGELPLGILTAFVGAPLFLYLIITGGRRHEH